MKKIFKNLSILGIITLVLSSLFILTSPYPVNAADGGFKGRENSSCPSFLGLISWDCNVNIENEETLKSGIWTIAANVATDITVIAAYLIVGYIIYGGYLYMFSGGDTGKVATGKKALYQAFIGLAIVMSANIIMAGIRVALVGGNGDISKCTTSKECVDPNLLFTNALQWVIGMAGVVSVIFIVYGGISYTTSAGDSGKLQQAKNMITYALIGLAIVALAETITIFVSNRIREANEEAESAYIKTTISKEVHEKIN